MKKHGLLASACAVAAMVLGGSAPAQSFSPPFEAAAVVADNQTRFESVLDYDGDGKMDAVSVWFPTSTSILVKGFRNDGAGRLVPDWSVTHSGFVNFPSSPPHATLGVGDFNTDGRADFVLTLNQLVGYWYSNGAGVAPSIVYMFAESSMINEVVTDDFDGDGDTDVALKIGLDLKVWMTQEFAPPLMTSSTLMGNSGTTHIFRAEGDGDGLPDVGVIEFGGLLGPNGNVRIVPLPGGVAQQNVVAPVPNVMSPMCVSGDVDGDGDVDVVSFSMGMPAYYHLARRTGPASFNVEPQAVGGPATNLVDLDLDGDLDGACCSSGGGGSTPNLAMSKYELSVNSGSGAFAPAFLIASLGAHHLAGAVDLEGDGDIDLVAGRCIYYGRGAGGVPPFPGPLGVLSQREIADVDGDGDVDAKPAIASYFANAGNGGFALKNVMPVLPPAGLTWNGGGFPGDFDGDGDPDLLVDAMSAGVPAGTHLLRNLGSGVFVDAGLAVPAGTSMLTLPPSAIGWTVQVPDNSFVFDLDLDGDQDVVTRSLTNGFNSNSGHSKVWWNQGAGTFLPGQDIADTMVVGAGHVDQDAIVDLIVQKHSAGGYSHLVVMSGLGTTWAQPAAIVDNDTHLANKPAIADLDQDGDLDLFSQGNTGAKLYTNVGNGTFFGPAVFPQASPPSRTSTPFQVIPHLAFALDVDVDGLVDVVATPLADAPGGMAILLNSVLNGPNPATASPIIQLIQPNALADVDGDGDHDAISPVLVARNARFGPIGAGYRLQYGTGIPGTAGITPVHGDLGPFRVGSSGEVRIRGGLGGAPAVLAIGPAPANVPLLGGTLLVMPDQLFPVQLGGTPGAPGEGGISIPFTLPSFLAGATLYSQVGIVDAGAPQGYSATNAIRIDIGQ
jgi:hypothetical protein